MKNKRFIFTSIILAGLLLSAWTVVQVVSAAPWPTATPTNTGAPTITPSITETLTRNEALATLQIRRLTPTITPWDTATVTLTPTSFLLPSFTPRPSIEPSPTSTPEPMPSSTSRPQSTDSGAAQVEEQESSNDGLSTVALFIGLLAVVGALFLLRIAYRTYRRKKMLYQIK